MIALGDGAEIVANPPVQGSMRGKGRPAVGGGDAQADLSGLGDMLPRQGVLVPLLHAAERRRLDPTATRA